MESYAADNHKDLYPMDGNDVLVIGLVRYTIAVETGK